MPHKVQHKPVVAISFQQEDDEKSYSIRKNYVEFIELYGGCAFLLVKSNAFEDTAQVLSLCDGVLIPGGDDINPALYGQPPSSHADKPHPDRDNFETKLVRHCIKHNLPFLGICRGFQIANVVLGGTLHQNIDALPNNVLSDNDIPDKHINHWQLDSAAQAVHNVELCENNALHTIFGTKSLSVNSIHHQTIDNLAPSLEVCAISEDGLIEALAYRDCNFFVGVQWHPEFAPSAPFSAKLGQAFIDACKSAKATKAQRQ